MPVRRAPPRLSPARPGPAPGGRGELALAGSRPGAARLPGAALLAGVASATPKLLPLDAADAMAVAMRLTPLADRVAEAGARSATLALSEGPVASAPLLELRAEVHAAWPEQGKVRLFAS